MLFLGNINFASADTASDTDTLLNWAENNYPEYFPTHQTTQSIAPWLFRFYPDKNVYAGVNTSNNGVYVLGGPWGIDKPTYIDSLYNLLSVAQNEDPTKITAIWMGSTTRRYYVLKSDGSVWTWLGGNSLPSTPSRITELTDITTIARDINSEIALALKKDGTVWQLYPDTAPEQIRELTDIVAINLFENNFLGGDYVYYALKNDGTVWIWGNNRFGQLGNGTLDDSYKPAPVAGLTNITAIYPSNDTCFALKDDGTIWAWGVRRWGASDPDGDGVNDRNKTWTPVKLLGLTDVTQIFISKYATKSDGTFWSLVDDSIDPYLLLTYGGHHENPIPIKELTNVVSVGSYPTKLPNLENEFQYYSIRNDGEVWWWKYNEYSRPTTSYTQIYGFSDIISIKHSTYHSLALKNDGTVWSWGNTLVDGAIVYKQDPVQVIGLTGITAIDVSPDLGLLGGASYALKDDGTLWAWGYFVSNALGNGENYDTYRYSAVPVQIKVP